MSAPALEQSPAYWTAVVLCGVMALFIGGFVGVAAWVLLDEPWARMRATLHSLRGRA